MTEKIQASSIEGRHGVGVIAAAFVLGVTVAAGPVTATAYLSAESIADRDVVTADGLARILGIGYENRVNPALYSGTFAGFTQIFFKHQFHCPP
jgi:hypothetical protein